MAYQDRRFLGTVLATFPVRGDVRVLQVRVLSSFTCFFALLISDVGSISKSSLPH